MSEDLLTLTETDRRIDDLVAGAGEIVTAYLEQDSGCVSYVVDQGGQRLFVKCAVTESGEASLGRAAALHHTIRHPALPALLHTLRTGSGPAQIYPWVPGDVLYDYVTMDGAAGRRDPASAHARFRALPIARILAALDAIYDLHVRIAEAGFIAVDFYDGCILYDFDAHRTWVCDLDEYRPGPFRLVEDRLPGSRRFMAPEEFVRGSTIDQRTNVYTLGQAAALLLGDGYLDSDTWRGAAEASAVLRRATAWEREHRYATVVAFVMAWRRAIRQLTAEDETC